MTEVFSTVVCGVDGSPEGLVAARAAARVTAPDGTLSLVAVQDVALAVNAGWGATAVAEQIADEARQALDAAAAAVTPIRTADERLREGDPATLVLEELRERAATLAVVGTHGVRRTAGILLGSVTTTLLHDAPCSVLVARSGADSPSWPRSIVVGLDGSAQSAAAAAAARELADRFGASLRGVAGAGADLDAARAQLEDVEEHDSPALDVLAVLSETSDLVVVGSRGLKGLRALGSVSERIAHQARSSVLVVRPRA